jgi:hypothetical protein
MNGDIDVPVISSILITFTNSPPQEDGAVLPDNHRRLKDLPRKDGHDCTIE